MICKMIENIHRFGETFNDIIGMEEDNKMFHLLLAIIYMAFISLGLPDSLLGSAWPTIYGEMNVPISYAGIILMIILGLMMIMNERLNRIHP